MTTRALEDAEIFALFLQRGGKYAVRNRTMLMVGIHLALRATELCELTVSDVYDGRTTWLHLIAIGQIKKPSPI